MGKGEQRKGKEGCFLKEGKTYIYTNLTSAVNIQKKTRASPSCWANWGGGVNLHKQKFPGGSAWPKPHAPKSGGPLPSEAEDGGKGARGRGCVHRRPDGLQGEVVDLSPG
jgi:hypothetical protein